MQEAEEEEAAEAAELELLELSTPTPSESSFDSRSTPIVSPSVSSAPSVGETPSPSSPTSEFAPANFSREGFPPVAVVRNSDESVAPILQVSDGASTPVPVLHDVSPAAQAVLLGTPSHAGFDVLTGTVSHSDIGQDSDHEFLDARESDGSVDMFPDSMAVSFGDYSDAEISIAAAPSSSGESPLSQRITLQPSSFSGSNESSKISKEWTQATEQTMEQNSEGATPKSGTIELSEPSSPNRSEPISPSSASSPPSLVDLDDPDRYNAPSSSSESSVSSRIVSVSSDGGISPAFSSDDDSSPASSISTRSMESFSSYPPSDVEDDDDNNWQQENFNDLIENVINVEILHDEEVPEPKETSGSSLSTTEMLQADSKYAWEPLKDWADQYNIAIEENVDESDYPSFTNALCEFKRRIGEVWFEHQLSICATEPALVVLWASVKIQIYRCAQYAGRVREQMSRVRQKVNFAYEVFSDYVRFVSTDTFVGLRAGWDRFKECGNVSLRRLFTPLTTVAKKSN